MALGQGLSEGDAGLALGGAGAMALAGSERDVVERAQDGDRWSDIEASYDRASLYSTLGAVGMGVGVAGAAAVLALHFLGSDDGPVGTQLVLAPSGVVVGGRW